MGTIVVAWSLLDPVIGVVIVFLAAWLRPWVVFIVAGVVLTVVNTALCTWVDRWWDLFAAGPGIKIEERLEKMRRGRFMRHPVRWITGGSAFWYSLAAMLSKRDPVRRHRPHRGRCTDRSATGETGRPVLLGVRGRAVRPPRLGDERPHPHPVRPDRQAASSTVPNVTVPGMTLGTQSHVSLHAR
jgi:hypothetical protein